MTVTFVRHTSVDIAPGVCYGQSEVPLTPSFPQEAARVCEQLERVKYDGVFTSPLQRCTLLAQFCGYENAVKDNRLMEMNFGEWEMRRYDEITDPRLQLWYDDYLHVRATGGESFEDQHQRLQAFIAEKKQQGYRHLLAFTHGGILVHALLLAGCYSVDEVFAHQPGYGASIQLEF